MPVRREASRSCPRFAHLTLTGGAIGSGPPMALGAAIAAQQQAATQQPGTLPRRVINLQADGSGMYSLQALWSQARERVDVTTIVCANSAYAILKVECMRQGTPRGGAATQALTQLDRPPLDWVALAAGMGVPGCRCDTAGQLAEALTRSLNMPGPYLIQADLT